MSADDALTPHEAVTIANNVYCTPSSVTPRASGAFRASGQMAAVGPDNPAAAGASLVRGRASVTTARASGMYSAATGVGLLGTTSGFGYTVSYQAPGGLHVVVAVRGTRLDMPFQADALTDLRFGMTSFASYGAVHKGFKKTHDSALPSIQRNCADVLKADVIHFVGHSLGGGVATLLAATFRDRGKAVRLYTFGCPRVGAMGAHIALERSIGKENIFRVAHDLDPVPMLAPFPYVHVNAAKTDENNLTIPSPSGSLLGNHQMKEYLRSVGAKDSPWDYVRGLHKRVDYDNSVLAKWLLHQDSDPGWVQFASAKTLGILFKLFSHVLANLSVSVILGLTAVDFLAEMLMKGLYKAKALADQIVQLLGYAAQWAGIAVTTGAEYTEAIIIKILNKMLSALRSAGAVALSAATRDVTPLPLVIAGGMVLLSTAAF